MKISIFGLGYVGCVNLACLAKCGFDVIGVDVKPDKVSKVNAGFPTIVEPQLEELFRSQRKNISATTDVQRAILETDLSLICVGTPPSPDGQLNLSHIWSVGQQIGVALKNKNSFHVIALRSTVLPGSSSQLTAILEKASSKKEGDDFSVIYNPEFLREGNAIYDYFHPGLIVLGSSGSQKALDMLEAIYSSIKCPIKIVNTKIAEMIKYVNNSWHALKIVFANECSTICRDLDIDSYELMNLFCEDQKLNLSSAYLKPGFAYGGYCLPKDLQGLISMSETGDVPMLSSIAGSNRAHIINIGKWICSFEKKRILFLGISFKEGTDDIRFSPKIELVQYLIDNHHTVHIYDKNITHSIKNNLNKTYLEDQLGHLNNHLVHELSSIIDEIDLIVLANLETDYVKIAEEHSSHLLILELTKTPLKSSYGYAWKQCNASMQQYL